MPSARIGRASVEEVVAVLALAVAWRRSATSCRDTWRFKSLRQLCIMLRCSDSSMPRQRDNSLLTSAVRSKQWALCKLSMPKLLGDERRRGGRSGRSGRSGVAFAAPALLRCEPRSSQRRPRPRRPENLEAGPRARGDPGPTSLPPFCSLFVLLLFFPSLPFPSL